MSAYEALAASYDSLTYDVDYEKIAQFYERLFRRYRLQPETVLDLACGTGSLSLLLAGRGYRVLGADQSEDMLMEASRKAAQMPDNAPYFICQPMQRLRLPQPVDAVVCCLDSVNYLTKPADCARTFARVFQALRPGGVFIFDINTPYKLKGLDGQVFLDENEDTYCVWRAEFDEKKNICYYGMDLFQREGEVWLRSSEEHAEYAYSPDKLEGYLREACFAKVERFADRKLKAPSETELRIYFAARKESE